MDTQKDPPCKQSFKGMENFLRRLAFNLGNTPSQTEVKIISCIPIDVSDLQQKINCLEKQLEEAKGQAQFQGLDPNNIPPQIQEQLHVQTKTQIAPESKKNRSTYVQSPNANEDKQQSVTTAYCTSYRHKTPQKQTRFDKPLSERSTSPLETQLPIRSTPTLADKKISHEVCSTNSNATTVSLENSLKQSQPLIISEPKLKEPRKYFLRKRNKLQKKKNMTPQSVYYAQATTAPAKIQNGPNVLDDMEIKAKRGLTQSYLAEVIERQYKPQNLGRFISNISEYSSPICRDVIQGGSRPRVYDSDACSCCSGPFHNIDHRSNMFDTFSFDVSNSAYYDSSLYDLVPVKEKAIKIHNSPMKKEPTLHIDMLRSTEQMLDNSCFKPFAENNYRSTCINNAPRERKYITNKPVAIHSKLTNKQKKELNVGNQVEIKSSPSCCIELGNIYMKMVNNNKPIPLKIIRDTSATPQRKTHECVTIAIKNTECQTISGDKELSEQKHLDDKTETTLNQIKTILQNVLTEVKTNNQLKDTADVIGKKDATVQNIYGTSQINLHRSSFLNSFTYNPYIPNPYSSSYSQHINSNHFTASYQSPLKCVNNYPILIQPGHHMSPNYYKHCPEFKPGCSKNTHTNFNSANKNTTAVTQRSNETEKLIKEIYNSMALNMSLPLKDLSNSECENIQPKSKTPSASSEIKKHERKLHVMRPASQIFMTKKILTDVSVDPSLDNSKSIYNPVEFHRVSNNTEENTTERSKTYTQESNNFSVSTATEQISHEDEELSSDTESEASDTETESGATIVPEEPFNKQKEHKGLFRKVMNLFKKDKDRTKNVITKTDAESATDSDDYQTIYSNKIEKPPLYPRIVNLPKHRTHSKVSNSKQMYRREKSPRRLPPYLEQEYRRQWTEKMFRDRREKKYSSERPMSREAEEEVFRYYQNLGSKSAKVEPRYYVPRERAPPVNQRRGNVRVEDPNAGVKRMVWLQKHKMGVRCGPQWKKLVLDN